MMTSTANRPLAGFGNVHKGVAAGHRQDPLVDFGLEGGFQCLVWVVYAEEAGVVHSCEASTRSVRTKG